jgi:hypothetical protein
MVDRRRAECQRLDLAQTDAFRAWKPGQVGRNNGVLVLVFVDGRKIRIQTGLGLENSLRDALCGEIITQQMAQNFRKADYSSGLEAALNRIMNATRDAYKGDGKTVAEKERRTPSASNSRNRSNPKGDRTIEVSFSTMKVPAGRRANKRKMLFLEMPQFGFNERARSALRRSPRGISPDRAAGLPLLRWCWRRILAKCEIPFSVQATKGRKGAHGLVFWLWLYSSA